MGSFGEKGIWGTKGRERRTRLIWLCVSIGACGNGRVVWQRTGLWFDLRQGIMDTSIAQTSILSNHGSKMMYLLRCPLRSLLPRAARGTVAVPWTLAGSFSCWGYSTSVDGDMAKPSEASRPVSPAAGPTVHEVLPAGCQGSNHHCTNYVTVTGD